MMKVRVFYLCWLCMLLFSCTEDLGNYDYHDLTEPEISGINTEISVLTFDKLQLKPDLGKYDFPDDRYGFEWKAIATDGSDAATVIGETRDLDYEVKLPEGAYKLYFTVTEKASGVYWQQNYHLQVNQSTSEGWMVLCSDKGRTRLDMVSAVTGKVYYDLLKDNGMPAWKGPRRIQQLSPDNSSEDSPFYLLTDEGATCLGRNGFEWKEEYKMCYEMGSGIDPIPHEIVCMAYTKIMVSGTDCHYSDSELYGSPVNKTFRAAPGVGTNISTNNIYIPVALIYDIDGKRFMGYASSLSGEMFGKIEPVQEMNDLVKIIDGLEEVGTIETGVTGNAFDRFPQGLDYVYMENTKYDPGNGVMGITYTILADGDRRYVYGVQLGDILELFDCNVALGKAYYGDISACTGITQAEHFAFSSLKNYMYYAVGGTVYRVDLSVLPLKAEEQFTLSGETITRLKFNLYRNTENLLHSYDLVVGSIKGDEGILRVYGDPGLEGDFTDKTPESYTGFSRIVDVTYREIIR